MADEGRGDRVQPAVELRASAVSGGSARVYAPGDPGTPVALRVEVSGQAGMGSITARPPRRRFWNWLLRRPRYALPAAR